MPALTEPPYLMPCPFCGCELESLWNLPNPRARCKTPECQGSRMPVLSLDLPEDIARWNTRATPPFMEQTARRQQLTDEQIDAIISTMPGGVDGFLKYWGFRQFARTTQAVLVTQLPFERFAPRWPLTNEQIQSIDNSTHFHESPDWPIRFARAIEAAHDITEIEN